MQQNCQRCGYEPVPGSKFCRQCGAPLVTETEASGADTRHYGRQNPAPFTESVPPPTPQTYNPPPPPSIADAFGADTARMQQPQAPPQPVYQQPYPPAPAYPAPPKSNWWKWVLGGVLALVLVCGGLIAYAVRQAGQSIQQVQSQVQEAIKKAEEEAAKAGRPSGAPDGVPGVPPAPGAPPPPPPPPGSEASLTMEKLKYPRATQNSNVNVFGQEIVEMTSDDELATVKAYYEKQIGAPVVESQDEGGKSVVFQQAPFMITLTPSQKYEGKTGITIIRSGLIPSLKGEIEKQKRQY